MFRCVQLFMVLGLKGSEEL